MRLYSLKRQLLGYCIAAASGVTLSSPAQALIQNFGEPNSAALAQSIRAHSLHVIQLGDSHTAADVMTDAMRVRLQSALGDGGMGWGMPMFFTGQRLARYGYDNVDWQPVSSRAIPSNNYTLGGFIAVPKHDGATLTIKSKLATAPQRIIVSIRQAPGDGHFSGVDAAGRSFIIEAPVKNNQWQTTAITASLPFTIRANHTNQSAIGGWWASNAQGVGAVVSALGINGAELNYMNRWVGWQSELATIRPNLLILAYGTNEAYNNVEPTTVKNVLTEKIRQIRAVTPGTAILIVSAPEVLRNKSGQCGIRPTNLSAIQQVQLSVAQTMRTLYWDWQAAQGGICSMKSWMNQGKANKDGVHFSLSGYNQIGQMLANDILALSGNVPMQYIAPTTVPTQYAPPPVATPVKRRQYTPPQPNPAQSNYNNANFQQSVINRQGSGEICAVDESGKRKCKKI